MVTRIPLIHRNNSPDKGYERRLSYDPNLHNYNKGNLKSALKKPY